MAEAAREEDWPRTVEEFEIWHARQPERWEFIRGQPRMMAPASVSHTIIKTNVGAELRTALAERGCTVMVDGAQILTDEISAIPDVVVTCSPIDHSTPVIAAPVIIVEVMSPSSEENDTGLRWLAYRNISSLRHYLVLSQDRRLVHVHSRAGDIWRERFISAGALELDEPPVRLELDALYAATDLAA
ncbi:MAG TPA: Uma2 family endonuclease [Geminicoccaceae bacterium]|jgi:Uma2 family endonuclease|nr:Uma2 family endonuclease [Geminicoccaceae bacterium]